MIRPVSAFNYNFRAPGSKIEGQIRYGFGKTHRELVLIGKSQKGVCAIFLGDSERRLCDLFGIAFPRTELHADQRELSREIAHVVGFIDKGVVDDVIDLDIGGTLFRQAVWQEICAIPGGQTRSYGKVAQDLGVPCAVRAVAGACSANMLAVAIPCHRVVGRKGSVCSYRWGLERKRALLADECEQ